MMTSQVSQNFWVSRDKELETQPFFGSSTQLCRLGYVDYFSSTEVNLCLKLIYSSSEASTLDIMKDIFLAKSRLKIPILPPIAVISATVSAWNGRFCKLHWY